MVEPETSIPRDRDRPSRFGATAWAPALSWLAVLVMLWAVSISIQDLDWPEVAEGATVAVAARWAVESPSPEWISGVPLTIGAYGPAHPWLVGTIRRWAPTPDLLVIGRVIALVAGLLAMAAIAGMAGGNRNPSGSSVLAAACFVAAPVVGQWWWLARVDAPAAALVLTAYVSAQCRKPLLAALLIVVASLVKQDAALHGLAIATYLYMSGASRTAGGFVLAALGAGAAAWVMVAVAFDGYFWQTSVLFHTVKQTQRWRGYELAMTYLPTAGFILPALLAARRLGTGSMTSWLQDAPLVGWAFSSILGLVLLMKEGAALNYMLLPVAFGAVLIGRDAPAIVSATVRGRLVAVSMTCLAMAVPSAIRLWAGGFAATGVVARREAVASLVGSGQGSIILSDTSLVPAVLAARTTPLVNDSFAFKVVVERQLFDSSVLEFLRRGQVPLILLTQSVEQHRRDVGTPIAFWPAPLLDAITAEYELVEQRSGIYVYKPRASPSRLPQ